MIFSSSLINLNRIDIMITEVLEEKLTTGFGPHHLEIINESEQHNVPKGSESHFKVIMVSEQFKGLRQLQRHRLVFDVIKAETSLIHAISLFTYTKEEWEAKGQSVADSPRCGGGSEN
jgi:BolA protein